jgi:hypothetical protein
VAWTHRNVIPQLFPGDGKAFEYALGGAEEEVGMFYSKGSVLDTANGEYFYMTPDYTPAGSTGTVTSLRIGGINPPLGSDSEFAEAVNLVWTEGSVVVINGCMNTKTEPDTVY